MATTPFREIDRRSRLDARRRSRGRARRCLRQQLPSVAGQDKLRAVIALRWGQAAPGFSLPSTLGRPVSLEEFKGRADVVVAFYCYDWGGI